MLTSSAILAIKNYIKTHIGFATYKSGGVDYTVPINETTIMGDGSISATITIPHSSALQITSISLYDVNGVLWAQTDTIINRETTGEGILFRFRFTVTEEMEVS